MEREGREGGGKGGGESKRENLSMEAFAGGVDLGKGGDRYALDGFTKEEIWLLYLTLLPSN